MPATLFKSAYLLILICLQTQITGAYYNEHPGTTFNRVRNRCDSAHNSVYQKAMSRKRYRTELFVLSDESDDSEGMSEVERNFLGRISRLEAMVSKQEVEIYRLRKENEELKATSEAFSQVIQMLREASQENMKGKDQESSMEDGECNENNKARGVNPENPRKNRVVESFDDSMIFGTAPSSVNDAADAAGGAILAAMLAGKQRMLVDVRDAELSSDPETLVQFIELAILPIAAGLEGLKSTRNRVKIVFPKVSQLLEYRRTMALAAPEVVALSTLGFDPLERRDKLVVIVAPEPDDEEGLATMHELLYPVDSSQAIEQPVVILNYHMVPVSLPPNDFETAYHLRLLAVQYMTGEMADEIQEPQIEPEADYEEASASNSDCDTTEYEASEQSLDQEKEEELEAAMKHAHEIGTNVGATRAMVIRAYPRPWNVFVDTSPDTDTDFEVAATFVEEPSLEEINMAIVECLEGSEHEEELVAQQMQQALEDGQLDQVSDMIGEVLDDFDGSQGDNVTIQEDDDDETDDEDFDAFDVDSI